MFVVLRLVTLPAARVADRAGIVAGLACATDRLDHVASSWAAPVLDAPVINAGHVVWRTVWPDEATALAATLQPSWSEQVAPLLDGAEVRTIGYRITRSGVRPAGAGIWRALVFRVVPAGFPTAAAALEAQTLLLPRYVAAIRSWALSPVSFCTGAKTYTHVWEQEFDDLAGLTGEYMTHPVHWGLVDSWFDSECPNAIVDPHLVQVVGRIDRTIMR